MKKLIVCCDGTANEPNQMDRDRIAPTNVVKLARALKKFSSSQQLVYYDAGLGTGSWIQRLLEGITGTGISQNIMEAYHFLAKHYEPGDEIFCFGFSRGAYTVRSLCGMIRTCGLLRAPGAGFQRVNEIYQAYRSSVPGKERDPSFLDAFRKDCYDNVQIKFLGVWDTVGSLGLPVMSIQAFDRINQHHNVHWLAETVQNAFHAVALDEFREQFRPSLLERQSVGLSLEQRWYAGSHSNIGGGYVDAGLSDLSLRTMIERAEHFGLVFDEDYKRRHIRPSYFGELRNSWTGIYRLTKHIREFIPNDENVLDESVTKRFLDRTTRYEPLQRDVLDTCLPKQIDTEITTPQESGLGLIMAVRTILKQETTAHSLGEAVKVVAAFAASAYLIIWAALSIAFIFSDWAFGAGAREQLGNVVAAVGYFVLYVVLAPLLILAALIALIILLYRVIVFITNYRQRRKVKKMAKATKA